MVSNRRQKRCHLIGCSTEPNRPYRVVAHSYQARNFSFAKGWMGFRHLYSLHNQQIFFRFFCRFQKSQIGTGVFEFEHADSEFDTSFWRECGLDVFYGRDAMYILYDGIHHLWSQQ